MFYDSEILGEADRDNLRIFLEALGGFSKPLGAPEGRFFFKNTASQRLQEAVCGQTNSRMCMKNEPRKTQKQDLFLLENHNMLAMPIKIRL